MLEWSHFKLAMSKIYKLWWVLNLFLIGWRGVLAWCWLADVVAELNSHWLLQTGVGGPYQMVIGGGQQYVLPSGAAAGHYYTAAAAGSTQVWLIAAAR